MKYPLGWIARRLRTRRPFGALVVGSALAAVIGGCSGSSSIPNLTNSAPPLPSMATYNGPRMNTPRYSHSATTLEDGTVLIVGGTDEIHLTAMDTVEIFDQSARVDTGQPIPESIAGDFIDQDIDGDLITLGNGGRFFHSATAIDDGQVIIIGGTTSIQFGTSIGPSEIYDPQTRTFGVTQIDPNNDIIFPRARHDARRLPSGRVLITGGQEAETVILPPQPGFPGIQFTQEARASTEVVEIFDPAALTFAEAVDDTGFPVELTTARGRAGHTTGQWAGFDEILNTGDDIIGIIGGFRTLSALSQGAPQDYYPWNIITTKLTSMDFYDTASGTMNLAQGLVLNRRVNDPIALNLGERNRMTPFGDPGMANAVYIIGGDSDETCPDGAPSVGEGTADHSELVIATFTGFGPGNGVRFSVVPQAFLTACFPPVTSSVFGNGHEIALGCCSGEFNRSRTGALLMEMSRSYDGQPFITSVVVAGGGIDVTRRQTCFTTIVGFCNDEIRGFQFFDPFYDIFHAIDTGEAPWNWTDNGSNVNPLGLRGTTLMYDADIPSETVDGMYDGTPTVSMDQARVMHTLTRIPGEDGLINTLDDRIVAIGGTNQYWPILGDDALSLSCEIFLPPDAGVLP